MIESTFVTDNIDRYDVSETTKLSLTFDYLLFFSVIFSYITQSQYKNALKEYINYKNNYIKFKIM